ncbi:Ran-binding protein 10, partial [Ophiophagus hannah]
MVWTPQSSDSSPSRGFEKNVWVSKTPEFWQSNRSTQLFSLDGPRERERETQSPTFEPCCLIVFTEELKRFLTCLLPLSLLLLLLLCLFKPGHGKNHKDAASVRATHPIPAASTRFPKSIPNPLSRGLGLHLSSLSLLINPGKSFGSLRRPAVSNFWAWPGLGMGWQRGTGSRKRRASVHIALAKVAGRCAHMQLHLSCVCTHAPASHSCGPIPNRPWPGSGLGPRSWGALLTIYKKILGM